MLAPLSEYLEATPGVERLNKASRSIIEHDKPAAPLASRPLFSAHEDESRRVLKREKAIHRIIVMLTASGMSQGEIATHLGVSRGMIHDCLRQPWAKEMVVEEIQRSGRSTIDALVQGAALDSVMKLIELRDAEKSPVETQRKAANDILDRAFGKPNQPITHREEQVAEMSDAELADLVSRGRAN